MTGEPRLTVTVDDAASFDAIDPAGPYVPVYVSGAVHPHDGSVVVQAPLALAVNGIIRATTETARRPIFGRQGFWAALVPADVYRAGRNEVDVFEIASTTPPVLRPVRLDIERDQPPNLLDEGIQARLGITQAGFYRAEWADSTFFRWTAGDANLTIPVGLGKPPRVLEVTILLGRETEQTLEIRANGCALVQWTGRGRARDENAGPVSMRRSRLDADCHLRQRHVCTRRDRFSDARGCDRVGPPSRLAIQL